MKTLLISLFLGCMALGGCVGLRSKGVKIDEVRPAPMMNTLAISVARAELQSALALDELTRRLRMVKVYEGSLDAAGRPEWRLFEIDQRSVYHLLGLRMADVLIAAEGYVVFKPDAFKNYVRALQNEKGAKFEIRRNGQPLLL